MQGKLNISQTCFFRFRFEMGNLDSCLGHRLGTGLRMPLLGILMFGWAVHTGHLGLFSREFGLESEFSCLLQSQLIDSDTFK